MSLDIYLENALIGSEKTAVVFHGNITHNLAAMAKASGLYKILWRPEDELIDTAEQMTYTLTIGLERLKGDPETFKKHNPSNGWGDYVEFVEFVELLLKACEDYPEATVRVWK